MFNGEIGQMELDQILKEDLMSVQEILAATFFSTCILPFACTCYLFSTYLPSILRQPGDSKEAVTFIDWCIFAYVITTPSGGVHRETIWWIWSYTFEHYPVFSTLWCATCPGIFLCLISITLVGILSKWVAIWFRQRTLKGIY